MDVRVSNASDFYDLCRRLLRWEKPVYMISALSPDEVSDALKALVPPQSGWRSLITFASRKPMTGIVVDGRGIINLTPRAFRIPSMRALHYSLSATTDGSELYGTLQVPKGLQIYQVVAVCFAFYLEACQLYWLFAAIKPDYFGIAIGLLKPFLVVPYLWLYVRLCLWLGRKREQELLGLVQDALLSHPPPNLLKPRPSTATEVFIRPRLGRPS